MDIVLEVFSKNSRFLESSNVCRVRPNHEYYLFVLISITSILHKNAWVQFKVFSVINGNLNTQSTEIDYKNTWNTGCIKYESQYEYIYIYMYVYVWKINFV